MEEKPSGQINQAKQYYDKGLAAYEKANYDYAIELLSQAILLDPANVSARHTLRCAEREKLKASPPSLLGKAKSTILAWVVSWFQTQKDSARAMTACEKALRANPNNVAALTKLARLALKADMVDVAKKTFEEIFEAAPNNIFALKKLATICLQKGELDKAKLYFEHILKLTPHDREADKGLKDLDALKTIEEGKWGKTS